MHSKDRLLHAIHPSVLACENTRHMVLHILCKQESLCKFTVSITFVYN
jgi:hypothetical protein